MEVLRADARQVHVLKVRRLSEEELAAAQDAAEHQGEAD
jgi:Mg2+/Co2+ transporter CorC